MSVRGCVENPLGSPPIFWDDLGPNLKILTENNDNNYGDEKFTWLSNLQEVGQEKKNSNLQGGKKTINELLHVNVV